MKTDRRKFIEGAGAVLAAGAVAGVTNAHAAFIGSRQVRVNPSVLLQRARLRYPGRRGIGLFLHENKDRPAGHVSVTGTVAFGTGSAICLSGLGAFSSEELRPLKIVIDKPVVFYGTS